VNVSLRLLRAFVAVRREGNVGRAAAKLFVSQPSLSQDIRRLEREIGVQLFVRGPQGMAPTAAGEELARCVEAALTQIDAGVDRARSLGAAEAPRLLVAFSPSIGNKLMPELLRVLDTEGLGPAVDEREVDTGDVGPGVRAGRFDAGLAHCPDDDPLLVATWLVDEPMCIALATEHPLAGRPAIQLAELRDLALLIWPRESAPSYFDHVMAICGRAGLDPPVVLGARRTIVRSYLLAAGTAFSLLPASTAALQPPGIAFVPAADDGVSVPLAFVRRADDERVELRTLEDAARRTSAMLATAHPPDEGATTS
jgi:DNA-binding transcriptional LysR family regulator